MGWFRKKILVTLIDDKTNEVIAKAKSPADSLPDDLTIDTQLSIGDDQWYVVSADPGTRAEYMVSKKLTIRLQRLEMIDPANLLYSLPSIYDAIPGCSNLPADDADPKLHEDDWRQFELVSQENNSAIDRQFAAIIDIHKEHHADPGWKKMHCRSEPEKPIQSRLPLETLREELGPESKIGGVSFRTEPNRILDGFSIQTTDGITLYGLAPAGEITVLGLYDTAYTTVAENTIASLVTVAKRYNLVLIHWCRCQKAEASIEEFQKLIMY